MPKTAAKKITKRFVRVPEEREGNASAIEKTDRSVRVREKGSLPNLPKVVTAKDIVDAKTTKKLRSMFGERTKEILHLVDTNQKDGAVVLIYKQLLKMLVTLVPVLEKVVRKSKGRYGTYQINQLVSQLRELLADMQAVQDRGLLGRTLIQRYVRPSFTDIAMQMVSNDQRIVNLVLANVSEDKREKVEVELRRNQRELARFMQVQYRHVAEEIIKGLT